MVWPKCQDSRDSRERRMLNLTLKQLSQIAAYGLFFGLDNGVHPGSHLLRIPKATKKA